jgi:hypothetical protein
VGARLWTLVGLAGCVEVEQERQVAAEQERPIEERVVEEVVQRTELEGLRSANK